MAPLTILLVLLLLTQASVSDIIGALASVGPAYLLASLALFFIIYACRSLRFAFMLDSHDYMGMFRIVCTHSMANNVMPFRTGELAFVYLAKARMNVPIAVGAAAVVVARLYDILAICLMFIGAMLLAGDGHGYFARLTPAIVFSAAALALLIAAILWLSRLFSSATARAFSAGILKKLQARVEQACGYCATLRPGKSVAWIFSLTVLMWATQALNFYILAAVMGLYLGFWAAIAGSLLAIIFVSLPIQGVGNFGSFELAWAAIFAALGAPVAVAVSSGFAVHVVVLALTALFWILGMLAGRFSGRKSGSLSTRRAPPEA